MSFFVSHFTMERKGLFVHASITLTVSGCFFRENAKTLRFDALVEKESCMYKLLKGHTPPYNSTQEKLV
jgi:hypothetical protein